MVTLTIDSVISTFTFPLSLSFAVYNSALTTGRHDIGFSFLIPPNVPSSMEHQLGSIKYKLKVKVSGNEVKNADLNLNILSSPSVSPNELFVSNCIFY